MVLDLGCGNGRLLLALEEKNIYYTGVDFSENLISQAKKRFPKGQFTVADLTDEKPWQDLGKEKFNKVFLIAVLHHFPTLELQKKLVKRIKTVLKKDGQLFLTVWNLYQIRFWPDHLKQFWKKITSGMQFQWLWIPYRLSDGREIKREINRFCYAFTKKELNALITKEGLKLEKIYYSKRGEETNWIKGFNLCLIARKC